MTLVFGGKTARAVLQADSEREKDRQAAPAKVVELGAELDRLADEAARFDGLYDELTVAWQALSADPWLAEALACLASHQERARLKLAELDTAFASTATALDHYAGLLDELDEGELRAAYPQAAAELDRYAALRDDVLDEAFQ